MSRQNYNLITFNGGINSSLREETSNGFGLTQHFDIFSDLKRLTPYRIFIPDEDKTFDIVNMLIYNSIYYGYGIVVGSGKAKVYQKAGPTGSWTASTTGEDSGGARNTDSFHQYRGIIYGWTANNRIWSYTVSSNTFTSTVQSISYTSTAQAITSKNSDTAYFPYDNKIASLNGTSWISAALTLPTNIVITSIEEWGNYLAVACRSNDYGNSVVYLWDMVSSDITQIIDFGNGNIKIIANLGGELIGISTSGVSSGDIASFRPKVTFRRYTGGNVAGVIKELQSESSQLFVPSRRQKENSIVYFPMNIQWNGANQFGIFAFGKKDVNSDYVLTFDKLPNNDTAVTSIEGIFHAVDYWWVMYNGDGSVNRTDDQALYTTTSILETTKYSFGDAHQRKRLVGVSVSTVPLPSGSQYIIEYRQGSETNYTTIATYNVIGSISKDFITVGSTGQKLPQFDEIQFRVKSTGFAEITGIFIAVDTIKTII